MRIWVTGARGFIGRHVCAIAAAGGHDVWAIVSPTTEGKLPPPIPQVLTLSLGDPAEVMARAKDVTPEAVIHLAWHAHPSDYLRSHENIESLRMTLTLARALLTTGCRRMVGVGTCLEYATLPRPRREDDPTEPQSLYARCKHAAHLVLSELFRREQGSLTWARLFHMHGPGEHPARLIPSLAAALRNGQPFALSPGEQVRDHLDVRDVASALVHLAQTRSDGPVNICSGDPVTLRTVLEMVGQKVGRPELLQFGARPYMPGEVMNLSGDATRLRETGWRPSHPDLGASLAEVVAATAPTL
jgi:nucleoside-diphosphate-sugar epimerase